MLLEAEKPKNVVKKDGKTVKLLRSDVSSKGYREVDNKIDKSCLTFPLSDRSLSLADIVSCDRYVPHIFLCIFYNFRC